MFAGWTLLRILSRNPNPQTACRPFDKDRDGLIISEGSAMLLLEDLDSAKERKVKIYGEIIGYGARSDAFHIAQPSFQGEALAIKKALEDANLNPEDIDYINAHGTSTIMNDKTETKAIKEIFKDYSYKIPVSSNKSMLGHSMGASGAIETIATVLTIRNGIIPPTVNYEVSDPECDLDYVPNSARQQSTKIALSNSFAFGGNNSVLVLKEYKGG
jgi:3-oxoacyl-(acyl-carrier-protein) synthase